MRTGWRGVRLQREMVFLLAILALALQVAVPPGYMVGGGGSDGPARIVICTGHGPIETAIDLGKSRAPGRDKHGDAPCAFAGHAAPNILAPSAPAVAVAWAGFTPLGATPAEQASIGRGRPAPPPARAPPISQA